VYKINSSQVQDKHNLWSRNTEMLTITLLKLSIQI